MLDTTGGDLVFTYNKVSYAATFSTSLASRDSSFIYVRMLEIPLGSYLYGCQFYYEHVKLSIMDVQITTVAIPTIYYTVGPAGTSVTLPAFSNNKGITGDAKLDIVYDVLTSPGGLSYSSTAFITGFNPTTRALSIQTADSSLPRNNALKVVAYFSYRPSYTVDVPFTVVLDNCFSTAITTPVATQMLY